MLVWVIIPSSGMLISGYGTSGKGTKRKFELENYLYATGLARDGSSFGGSIVVNPIGRKFFEICMAGIENEA